MDLDLESYEKQFEPKKLDFSLSGALKTQIKRITQLSSKQWLSWVASWVPAIKWIPRYNLRSYIVPDLLTGFTISIFNIPQGMAFGMLAGLAPINGLYTSLFLPLVYTFLGSSIHVSLGVFAISSLMTATVLDNQIVGSNASDSLTSSFWCAEKTKNMAYGVAEESVEIGVTLALLVGLCQILLGGLKLGFLTILLSDQLIQALTTGAAVHIFSSQIKHAFGIDVTKIPGPISLVKFYVCLFKHITETNVAALVTCIICIAVLYLTKTFIDPKVRPKLHFPIPMELIVVIATTLISWQVDFKSKFGVSVVGEIPQGIEPPKVPNLPKWIWRLLPDAISIAVVSYAIEVSVAKHCAKKYHYDIHTNQVVSLINCMVILVVLLALAGLFRDLPKCTLSAIIIVVLRNLFKQLGTLPSLFKKSKIDFMIWIVAFAAVVLWDVIQGVAIGVSFALLTVIGRSLWPHSFSVQQMPASKKFHELGTFNGLHDIRKVKIFRFGAPLYYGNVENFKSNVYEHMGVDPVKEKRKKIKPEKKRNKSAVPKKSLESLELSNKGNLNHGSESRGENVSADTTATSEFETGMHLIIDCSSMSYIDVMGANALIQIYQEYSDIDIGVFYANLCASAKASLEEYDFFKSVGKKNCFFDLADAVENACKTQTRSSVAQQYAIKQCFPGSC